MAIVIVLFLSIAACCLLIIYMHRQAMGNEIIKEKLAFSDYPSEAGDLTIFFISDIHRRLISDRVIEEVKESAKFVIIGGDLAEKGVPQERIASNIQKLASIGQVYFIWGNNDYELNREDFIELLTSMNVKMLKNEAFYLPPPHQDVMLVGLDYIDRPIQEMRAILHSAGKEPFKLLLCHAPPPVNEMEKGDAIALVLSGHTHGGQIRLFGLGPYQKGGVKRNHATTLLVSNGYGTSLIPLRLGAPAQSHLITISHTPN